MQTGSDNGCTSHPKFTPKLSLQKTTALGLKGKKLRGNLFPQHKQCILLPQEKFNSCPGSIYTLCLPWFCLWVVFFFCCCCFPPFIKGGKKKKPLKKTLQDKDNQYSLLGTFKPRNKKYHRETKRGSRSKKPPRQPRPTAVTAGAFAPAPLTRPAAPLTTSLQPVQGKHSAKKGLMQAPRQHWEGMRASGSCAEEKGYLSSDAFFTALCCEAAWSCRWCTMLQP